MTTPKRKLLAAICLLLVIVLVCGLLGVLFHAAGHQDSLKHLQVWFQGADYEGTDGVEMQRYRNDCGPAALAMVLAHYGMTGTVTGLRDEAGLSANGTSMLRLRQLAEDRGLHAEGWRLTFRDLKNIPKPAIAFVRDNHFVVVQRIDKGERVYVLDPSLGRLVYQRAGFQKLWKGHTLVFSAAPLSLKF